MNKLSLAILSIVFLTATTMAQIKIACVGNSITAGTVVGGTAYAYPAFASALLGSGYTVNNYGVSGTCMLKNSDSPYWRDGMLKDVFSFLPNVVTISLGGNDSKPQNWDSHNQEFKRDYNAMIDTLSAMSSHPKIWLVLPVPVITPNYGINDTAVRKIIVIIRQIATERGLPIIDENTPLLAKPQLYTSDGVHPNVAGEDTMGHVFYRALISQPQMIISSYTPVFAVAPGQTSGSDQNIISIDNLSTQTTLDSIRVSGQKNWLNTQTTGTPRNHQKMTLSINYANVPQTENNYYDTLTFTAANASPSQEKIIVCLKVRQPAVLAKIIVSPDSLVIAPLQQFTYRAVAFNQYGETIVPQPTFSWSATAGSFSGNGIYTAPSAQGRYTITATANAVPGRTGVMVITGITFLPPGNITNLLLLKNSSNSPYIPRGTNGINYNFFPESTAVPLDNGSVTINTTTYTWRLSAKANGMWVDSAAADNFVAFGAIYLFTPFARTVYLAYKHDDDFSVRLNGRSIVNAPFNGQDGISNAIPLQPGVSKFLFKLVENTGGNNFAVRFIDSTGADISGLAYQFTPTAPTLPPAGILPKVQTKKNDLRLFFRKGKIIITLPGNAALSYSILTITGRCIETGVTVKTGHSYVLNKQNLSDNLYLVRIKNTKTHQLWYAKVENIER
jgi:lysophospholipase L1-like esterase